jgi:hypothetical protein
MRGIGREIAGVLALKIAALAILYFAFFAHAPATTPLSVSSHVMGE